MRKIQVNNYEVTEQAIEVITRNKQLKGNRIVEEKGILKVYSNTNDAQPFIFDADDKEKLKEYTICRNSEGYAVARDRKSGKQVYLHRVIMEMLDKPSGDIIDHIDGDKSNNRKSNLRICHAEDASNQSNVHYKFYGSQKVNRYRTPDDKFVLGYTDGIIPYFEFEYKNFSDLIEDYTSLYEQGFERVTKYKLLESKLECLERIENSRSRKLSRQLKAQLKELETLITNVDLAYAQVRLQKARGFELKGLINLNGKLVIGCEIDRTPKELVESGITPNILYLGNYCDKEPAGTHSIKPNGEEIY